MGKSWDTFWPKCTTMLTMLTSTLIMMMMMIAYVFSLSLSLSLSVALSVTYMCMWTCSDVE